MHRSDGERAEVSHGTPVAGLLAAASVLAGCGTPQAPVTPVW